MKCSTGRWRLSALASSLGASGGNGESVVQDGLAQANAVQVAPLGSGRCPLYRVPLGLCAMWAVAGMKSVFAASGMPPFLRAVKRVEAALRRKYGAAGRLPEIGRILAVDPGKITGVSVFWFSRRTGKVVAWAETLITHNEHIQVWDVLSVLDVLANEGRTDMVIESFIVHSVKKEASFLSPVRIGSPIEWGALDRQIRGEYLYPVSVYMVPPSEMSAMDDPRLKALGHFTPGPDHRRDATRHALLHLKRIRDALQNSRKKSPSGKGIDVTYWRWSGQENPLPFGKAPANPAPTPRVSVQLNGVSVRKPVRYFDEN